VIIVRDGKIAALYVFVDSIPFIAATALSMIARLIATRVPSARYPQFSAEEDSEVILGVTS